MGINNNDFMLGIMTVAQANLFKKFGNGGTICMDATHGTNPYDFNLITVLTIDDFGEGLPLAFFFSNREDYIVIKHFINSVKEVVGAISVSVFMSDDAEQYFSTWISVMPCNETKKLLCVWHVDRAWRNKINLINNKEKQNEIYKMLCILRQEPHHEKFKELSSSLIIALLNSEPFLLNFKNYIMKYTQRTPLWATCFRVGCGINTNMHLESMHKVLKYIYLKGTVCRRLNKTISVLLKYVRDKQFSRVIKLIKGKNSANMANSNKRHLNASHDDNMTISNSVSGKEWQVVSGNNSYTVTVSDSVADCSPHNCKCKYTLCNACLHIIHVRVWTTLLKPICASIFTEYALKTTKLQYMILQIQVAAPTTILK